MAVDVAAFTNDLSELVRQTWVEVVPNETGPGIGGGIWLYDQIVRRKYLARTFPWAVIDIPRLPPDDWGLTVAAYRPLVEVHYIGEEEFPLELLQERLTALVAALMNASFRNGVTILTEPEMDWSGTHPANQVFYEKNQPFRAGVVTFPAVIHDQALALP